jgi:radical SAM superfamily enzyme YgiQ (UPF0313 family)
LEKKSTNKCLFISPPELGKFLPRGLLSIASFIESKGYPGAVVPLSHYLPPEVRYSTEKIRSILEPVIHQNNPFLIGVSSMTADYHTSKEILKACKEIDEKIITVIGGMHPTFLDLECIDLPYTDIVVRGEGEWTFLALLSALENNQDLDQINGLTFKKNGKIIQTPDRDLGDLSELPPLNFNLLPEEFVKQSYVMGMLSRGCAFNCYFCADKPFWKRVRQFPITHVIKEMEVLNESYNNPMMGIEDNMVYIGSDHFSDLCSEIKQRKLKLGSHFHVQTRVDSILNDQGLKDIEGTGIEHVVIGIESGSPRILKLMNKKTSPEMIISACEKFREYNLLPIGVWMIGYPGDTPEDQQKSLELLEFLLQRDLLKFASFSYFVPWPGTRFYHNPEHYDIEILEKDRSTWYYCQEGERRVPMCQLKGFSADEMAACYQKGFELIDKYSAIPFWKRKGDSGTISITYDDLS